MSSLPLSDRRALVCGASQGIGRAIAHDLAARGAGVTILARSASGLEDVLQSLPDTGIRHNALSIDLTDHEALDAALGDLRSSVGHHDILINNSGGPKPGPLHQADPNDLVPAFNQHVVASQKLLQAFLGEMQQQKFGRVVNIISTSVKQPIPGLGISNTIRGAMANWAKTLANELGPFGITVNNVLPGATKTGRLASIIENRAKAQNKSEQEVEQAWRETIPLRRFADPEEIAAAVGFLVSPDGSYITGINLPVDGGRTSSL